MLLGDHLTAPLARIAVLTLEDVIYDECWEPLPWTELGTAPWTLALVTAVHPEAYVALFLARDDDGAATGYLWGSGHAPRPLCLRPAQVVDRLRARVAGRPGWTIDAGVVR